MLTARTLLGLANQLSSADEMRRQMAEEALAILRPRRREIPLVVADALAQLCEQALEALAAQFAETHRDVEEARALIAELRGRPDGGR